MNKFDIITRYRIKTVVPKSHVCTNHKIEEMTQYRYLCSQIRLIFQINITYDVHKIHDRLLDRLSD